MYAVLDKDTIKNEILPHLSKAKRGYVTQSCLIEVVNAILYKLKTGCQWALLPVKALFSGKVLSYGAVFHHYRKWCKSGEWKSMWIRLLDKYRMELDMSSVDLDGSHTAALRGGEEVGYQGRKKRKTTNALYLTDREFHLPCPHRNRENTMMSMILKMLSKTCLKTLESPASGLTDCFSMLMPVLTAIFYGTSFRKKKSSPISASTVEGMIPMTFLWMTSYTPKDIPSNEPTHGWTVSEQFSTGLIRRLPVGNLGII